LDNPNQKWLLLSNAHSCEAVYECNEKYGNNRYVQAT